MKKDNEVKEEAYVYWLDAYLACLSIQSFAGQRVYIQNLKTIAPSQDARIQPKMLPEQSGSGLLCAQHPYSVSAFPSNPFPEFIRILNTVYQQDILVPPRIIVTRDKGNY